MAKEYTVFNCRLEKEASDKLESISELSGLSKTKIVEQAIAAMARKQFEENMGDFHDKGKSGNFAWESNAVSSVAGDDSILAPKKATEIADKIVESNVQPVFEAAGLNFLANMTVPQFVSTLVQIREMMEFEIPNPSLEFFKNAKAGHYDVLDEDVYAEVLENAKTASVLWRDKSSMSVKDILKAYMKLKFVSENLF